MSEQKIRHLPNVPYLMFKGRSKRVVTDKLESVEIKNGTIISPLCNDTFKTPDGKELSWSELQSLKPEWFEDCPTHTEEFIKSLES